MNLKELAKYIEEQGGWDIHINVDYSFDNYAQYNDRSGSYKNVNINFRVIEKEED